LVFALVSVLVFALLFALLFALVLVLFCGLEYYVYICDVKVLVGLIGALRGVGWGLYGWLYC